MPSVRMNPLKTNFFITEDYCEKIGSFLDKYVKMADGSQLPRNIPYFRKAIMTMYSKCGFKTKEEIITRCLKEKSFMLPDILFDGKIICCNHVAPNTRKK